MTISNVLACLLVVGLLASTANALNMETVTVGNAGNAGELSGAGAGGYGPDRICGSVGYSYKIGKYEVTAGQYTEFLNAVAKTDTHGLYNASMASSGYGCNIQRSGDSGNYTYSVASDYANRPVNWVSYWDSCRFANWMHNGQDNGDTETGAYTLTTDGINNNTVVRNADWKWAISSEDEWYKAAYHKNDGVTGNYWRYTTSSDSMPSNLLVDPTDPGNNATYYDFDGTGNGGYTSPYYQTEVGSHENSESSYGTFDQGGNVWERNESVINDIYRGVRGGSYGNRGIDLNSSGRFDYMDSLYEDGNTGFRVVEVPEPGTMMLLVFGGMAALRRKRQ